MRRVFCLISSIFFIAVSVNLLTVSIFAADEESGKTQALEDIWQSLPEKVKGELGYLSGDLGSLSEPENILSKLKNTLLSKGRSLLPDFSLLIGTVFAVSILTSIGRSIGTGGERVFSFLAGTLLSLSVFRILIPVWNLCSDTIKGIGSIMKNVTPIMTAINLSSGGASSSAASATWLSLLLTFTEQLCESLLSPLLSICLGFNLLCALSGSDGSLGITDISERLKKTLVFFLSMIGAIVSIIMTQQSVVASKSDGVLLRSVKFASGNLIPIIGGALSEASGSYLSSMSLIRSGAGGFIIAAMLVYLFPAFASLIVSKLFFSITSALSSMILGTKAGAVIKDACTSIDLAIAVLSIVTVCFLVALGVFSSVL